MGHSDCDGNDMAACTYRRDNNTMYHWDECHTATRKLNSYTLQHRLQWLLSPMLFQMQQWLPSANSDIRIGSLGLKNSGTILIFYKHESINMHAAPITSMSARNAKSNMAYPMIS